MQSALERRQEMIEYLCECRSTNRSILAAKFNVTTRTIDNDILVLTCSYPIFTKQGRGGNIYIEEGYYLHKQYLSTEEQNLLEKIKSSMDIKDAETLESIIQKFGRR